MHVVLYSKKLTSIAIILMGDAEFTSRIEVVIDASIVSSKQSSGHKSPSSILTRLHAAYFEITLSIGAQALLWKVVSEHTNDSQGFHHVFQRLPSTAFLLLWSVALLALVTLSPVYILRCFFHFDMVKAEFLHHIGVNFLYAPWISWLLMLQSAPLVIPLNDVTYYQVLWLVFAVPIVVLDVKIYGQWFTTERKFLSIRANPTCQISVLGNLVGARAAAQMGWKESAVFLFSLGMVHYLVLFVTLYQRLAGGNRFPAMLRPAFFLFFAAPSMASLAWSSISGAFDTLSKLFFFLSLFLFISLACRPALFKKSMKRFNIAWWGYSFPLTFLALVSMEYAREVKGLVAVGLMLVILTLCVLVFVGLMMLTALNSNRLLSENDPILRFTNNEQRRATTRPRVADDPRT